MYQSLENKFIAATIIGYQFGRGYLSLKGKATVNGDIITLNDEHNGIKIQSEIDMSKTKDFSIKSAPSEVQEVLGIDVYLDVTID